jgi:hypothetical protein
MFMGQQNQNSIGHNNHYNKSFDKSQKIYFNYLISNSNSNSNQNQNQNPSNQQFKSTDLLLL